MPPATPDEPKKFIRTFASDLAALKEGAPAPVAPEAPVAVTPEAVPEPAPVLQSVPETAPVAETPVAPAPVPLPELGRVPPPITGPTPIHTYAGDFSTLIKEEQASTATVLAAEEDQGRPAPVLFAKKTSRSSYAYVIGGIILVLLGGGAAFVTYVQYLAKTGPVSLMPSVGAPIFVDDRAQLSGTGALVDQINASVAKPLGMTGVRLLYTGDSLAGTSTVFAALRLPAPGALTRNIVETGGMAGVISVSGSQSPFFIIEVSSYADTFAAMLAWEETMPRDLSALFAPFPVALVATTTATSTGSKGALPMLPGSSGFRDETVANHDVRAYLDDQNRPVFLYGYWDQHTLLIARSPAAFTELINRLANSRAH